MKAQKKSPIVELFLELYSIIRSDIMRSPTMKTHIMERLIMRSDIVRSPVMKNSHYEKSEKWKKESTFIWIFFRFYIPCAFFAF